jgi:hypothetical protein
MDGGKRQGLPRGRLWRRVSTHDGNIQNVPILFSHKNG